MMATTRPFGVMSVLLALGATAAGGEFDRLDGASLEALARRHEADGLTRLSARDLDALPRGFRDANGVLLVATTDRGSFSALLVSPALRRPPGSQADGVPVLVVERLATFEPGRAGDRTARAEGLLLFDGFFLDLDAGVVTPAGQGGDLVFRADGDAGPRLEAIAPARIFTPGTIEREPPAPAGPSTGKAVVPADFNGRYRLFADGRWTGRLELVVADDRAVTGRFRSEPNGTVYPVRGVVEPAPSNAITFTIAFPRTEQEYAGRLWSDGKSGMAGTFTMLDRDFGFFALREGAALPVPD